MQFVRADIIKFIKKYELILVLLGCILISFVIFWGLWDTFYQQDEWLGLGQAFALKWGVVTSGISPVGAIFAEGRPLSRLFGFVLVKYFPYDSLVPSLYGIFLHSINSFIVFLISRKLLRSNGLGIVATIFFLATSVSHQSITWFAASFGLQPAAFFTFLSVWLYLLFLDHLKYKYFLLSISSAFISLYFKESGIFVFVLFPVIPFLLKRKIPFVSYLKLSLPIIIGVTIFGCYRIFQIAFVNTYNGPTVYANSGMTNLFPILIMRSILYPFTSFSLVYFPSPISTFIAFLLKDLYYPFIVDRPDRVVFTSILDNFAIICSFILSIMIFQFWKKYPKYRNAIVFSITFFILSILPYILISKEYSYMEPRYYYLTNMASGIILAVFFDVFTRRKGFVYLLSTLFALYIFFQIVIIQQDIGIQKGIATERRSYLSQLNTLLPTVNSNSNLFLLAGSKSLWKEGNYTPFQHGFGYSIMALYYKSGKIPKELLASQFLWDIGEEGYREVNGKKFGFFYDTNHLAQVVKKNKLNINDIHAFYYNFEDRRLFDISGRIRKEVEATNSAKLIN